MEMKESKLTIRSIVVAIVGGLFLGLGLVPILVGCSPAPEYRVARGGVWTTTYNIVYRSGVNLEDSIQKVFYQVDESLSPFAKGSLVSAINRGETNSTDSLFRHIFRASQLVSRLSGGLFDPTVSPLINLWGFGYKDKDRGRIPNDEEIAEALKHVGIRGCRIESDTLVRVGDRTEFNFSAITKGYGCDLVGEMLRRNGVEDYMIEIGGEVALSGVNPRGEDWRIMIDAPIATTGLSSRQEAGLVKVTDCGIATSGNYRNYKDTEIGRVGHTINPLTGYPAISGRTLSATVIAESAMMADALATACMAMEVDSAMKMVESLRGTEAMIILRGEPAPDVEADSDSARWEIVTTPGFPKIERGIVR